MVILTDLFPVPTFFAHAAAAPFNPAAPRCAQQNKQNRILDDAFIMQYVEPLKVKMREQVLLDKVKPYRRITLDFVATELNLSIEAVVS